MKKRFWIFLTVLLWIALMAMPSSADFSDGELLCFVTSPAAVTPTLDGVISLDEYTQIAYNPETDINFAYYEDRLAECLEPDMNTVYMSYDDTYVYVAATTTASGFHNAMDENPGDIWGQYCVQMSFADVSNDDPDSRLEVGYALSSETGNLLFANWCDGRGTGYNAVPGEDFVVVNRNGILTYEARVPFSAFTVGESIENIRFAIVWATGQGEGQDTYLLLHTQLAGGITGADGKDVTKHAVISLTSPVSREPISGSCGENAVYTLAGSRLTISGEGAVTVPFDQILSDVERLSVRSVVVEEGITVLDNWTFSGFENMTEISLPDSLTLLAPFCFNCCWSLPSVKLPPDTVLDFPFVDCGVRYVDTEDSNLYVVDGDVLYTADHTELVLDFNDDEWFVTVPEGVEIIRPYAYYAHHEIQRLILPESLIGIHGGAFGYCENLNFVVIPKNVEFTDSFFGESFFAEKIIFEGNAPHINGYFSEDPNMTVYYRPDTTGWDTAFDSLEFEDGIANTINSIPLETCGSISYGVPVLDGSIDALYLNSSTNPLEGDNILWQDDGREDLTVGGKTYLSWDETHIYVHTSILDEEVCGFIDDGSGNSWQNDMVELWFMLPDASGKNKLGKIQASGADSFINCVDESSGGYASDVLFDIGASEVFRTRTNDGYAIELSLKLADGYTLEAGDIIGYSMQLNDLDSDGLLCVGFQNAGCELYTLTDALPAQVISNMTGEDGAAGDTISVTLTVDSAVAVNTITYRNLVYDTSVLTFLGFGEEGDVPDNAIMKNFDEREGYRTIILTYDAHDEWEGEGTVCTLQFKINDNAPTGDYTIGYSSVMKNANTVIPSEVVCASVHVEGMEELLGDIDGDGDVDANDAILLLQYSVFPDLYPIAYTGNVDFDHDTYITNRDAILLLKYSVFPDLYPLG